MKHAILIIGHSNIFGVKKMFDRLNHENIDFYVHWDAKSENDIQELIKQTTITLVPNIEVNWGGKSQVEAELSLFKEARKKGYDYYHLVSDSDVALMDVDYFLDYFSKYSTKEYIGFSDMDDSKLGWEARLKYYYRLEDMNINRNLKKALDIIGASVQKVCAVNRLKSENIKICKGPQWCSVTQKFIDIVLSEKWQNWIYEHMEYSSKMDEIYKQTIAAHENLNVHGNPAGDDGRYALRYIDWERGNPYQFVDKDVYEVKKIYNTEYAFLRKVSPKTSQKLYQI